ncbi:putative transmembrane protein (plasmid) [Rhizobium johnstonii 3841]|uniref:Transmembrane protein n=1 Tax=Rhizobium johnstonii (strain DSM 114642 / LMG 32736 / 3841) TaxID=216596 RepID=Q1M7Z8_RHIJ3|nr:putative transmembrane protein [Rhizobium johnstonii 3841]
MGVCAASRSLGTTECVETAWLGFGSLCRLNRVRRHICLVYVVQQSVHNMNYGALGVVQTLRLLLGPLAAAIVIIQRTSLAAGVFPGVAVGFCVYVATATTGIGIYGE